MYIGDLWLQLWFTNHCKIIGYYSIFQLSFNNCNFKGGMKMFAVFNHFIFPHPHICIDLSVMYNVNLMQ